MSSAKAIGATNEECEAAAYLYLFGWFLSKGDLVSCAEVAPSAFENCREDTMHCVYYRRWIEKMLDASLDSQADAAALQYLNYLNREDTKSQFIRKRIGFIAAVVRPQAARLPKSDQYLREKFTDAEIEPPFEIYKGLRAALQSRAHRSIR